jgi:hypothetical protein
MAIGLCAQVLGSAPLFEAHVPRLWQAPLVAVSVANAVLFWLFVQAMFDDEFVLRPAHVAVWLAVAALSGLNCAVLAGSGSVIEPVTMGLQRWIPLFFALLVAIAAASHWRADLVERRRRLRGFIVLTGIAYTIAALTARLGSPHAQLSGTAATTEAAALLAIAAVVAARLLRLGGADLFPAAPLSGAALPRRQDSRAGSKSGEPERSDEAADSAEGASCRRLAEPDVRGARLPQ